MRPAQPPFGADVGLARQRAERRTVELLEEPPPADAEMAHRAVVEIGKQGGDGGVELGEREEALVAHHHLPLRGSLSSGLIE
jgi:hypothetical protein